VSTRTIVEINHDHLAWAQEHPQTFGELIYEALLKTYRGAEDAARQRGISVLTSRRHARIPKMRHRFPATPRPHHMALMLSDKELAVLQALAAEQGLSQSALLRQALRLYQATVHPPPNLGPMMLAENGEGDGD
jgi:hypothetical protein